MPIDMETRQDQEKKPRTGSLRAQAHASPRGTRELLHETAASGAAATASASAAASEGHRTRRDQGQRGKGVSAINDETSKQQKGVMPAAPAQAKQQGTPAGAGPASDAAAGAGAVEPKGNKRRTVGEEEAGARGAAAEQDHPARANKRTRGSGGKSREAKQRGQGGSSALGEDQGEGLGAAAAAAASTAAGEAEAADTAGVGPGSVSPEVEALCAHGLDLVPQEALNSLRPHEYIFLLVVSEAAAGEHSPAGMTGAAAVAAMANAVTNAGMQQHDAAVGPCSTASPSDSTARVLLFSSTIEPLVGAQDALFLDLPWTRPQRGKLDVGRAFVIEGGDPPTCAFARMYFNS